MARKTEASDKKKNREPGALRRLFADRQRLVQLAGSIVSAAILLTVLTTIVVGQQPLLTRAAKLKGRQLQIAFDWPPLAGKHTSRTASGEPATWMNTEQRRELELLAIKMLTGDPFDGASLKRTGDALRETGWFADGPWLKRYENGVVLITGKWRSPAAAVRTKMDGAVGEGGMADRLVTSSGELLPISYPLDRSKMKVVVGVTEPAPKLGEKWGGGDVQAGLALLNYLRAMPGYQQVSAVDVAEFAAHKRLSLLSDTGGRILWGGDPQEFNPGQAAPAIKRQRLAQLFSQTGRVDAGRTFIDARSEDGLYVQDDTALAAADDPASDAPAPLRGASRRR